MSSSEQRIRSAAKRLGIQIEDIRWEPIGMALEMCGPSGGWIINGGQFLGYHWQQVVADMQRFHNLEGKD